MACLHANHPHASTPQRTRADDHTWKPPYHYRRDPAALAAKRPAQGALLRGGSGGVQAGVSALALIELLLDWWDLGMDGWMGWSVAVRRGKRRCACVLHHPIKTRLRLHRPTQHFPKTGTWPWRSGRRGWSWRPSTASSTRGAGTRCVPMCVGSYVCMCVCVLVSG